MKVLLLMNEDSEDIYGEFYSGLHKQIGSVDYRRIGDFEQENLKKYFKEHVDLTKYDRIIFDLHFLIMAPQARFFRQLDNIVFIDYTACFDEMLDSPHYLQHTRFYKKLPWSRVITSSYQAMDRLQSEGIDAWCVPEGYSTQKYANANLKRDISLVLIDNKFTESSRDRVDFMEALKTRHPQVVIEDNVSGNTSRLNRARMAICADMGAGEYGGKVFSAMASGCLVFSYNQGRDESLHMGLLDMENIVLFSDFDDFQEKLDYLNQYPDIIEKIAKEGQDFAVAHHQQMNLGRQAGKYIAATMRKMSDYRKGFSAFGYHF